MNDQKGDLPRPDICYIDTLPDEILGDIQVIAIEALEKMSDRYTFSSTLCQVSRRWYMATPRIWSFIFISNKHTLKYLAVRLSKTGSVPLRIGIEDPYHELEHEEVMRLLLPFADRWLSLDIKTHAIYYYTRHFPVSLPLLQDIAISNADNPFTISTLLPNLKSMTLTASWLCWEPTATFEHLTTIHVMDGQSVSVLPISKMLHLLQNSPNLETLDLADPWLFEVPDEEPESLLSQVANLPKLRAMRLGGLFSWEFVILLSWIRAPALQNLMFGIVEPSGYGRGRPSDLTSIDRLHFDFSSLQKLTLKDIQLPKKEIQHLLLQMPKIQTLSLISSPKIDMAIVLDMLVNGPEFGEMTSHVSVIHLQDISMAAIGDCLSKADRLVSPKSSILRAKWIIHGAGINESVLGRTEAQTPSLEISNELLRWD